MKKRILSLFLTLALCMGLTVPASAAQSYQYEELTFTDTYGNTYTFDKAAYFFSITLSWYEDEAREQKEAFPVVVLKDNSRVKVSGQSSMLDSGHEGYANLQGWKIYDGYYEYVVNKTFTSGSVNDMIRADEGANAFCAYIMDGNTKRMTFFVTEQYASEMDLIPLTNEPNTASTMFQSTATLTAAAMADMDYNSFTVTVTNNTDATDVGIVALVLASDIITVSPMSYEVPAHSSVDYEVNTVGHMGHLDSRLTLVSGIENYVNASVVHFESIEDYYAFCESFPVESNEDNGLVMQNADVGSIMVCSGAPGDLWVMELGIGRKASPADFRSNVHRQCGPLSLS